MHTEQFIEGTRGQTILYNGERYTLEEDIHWDWPTYRDGTDKKRLCAHRAVGAAGKQPRRMA